MEHPDEAEFLQEQHEHREDVEGGEADEWHRAQQRHEHEELVFLPEDQGLVELHDLAGFKALRSRDPALSAAFVRFVEAVLRRNHDEFAGVVAELVEHLPNQSVYWVDVMRYWVRQPKRAGELDLLITVIHELKKLKGSDQDLRRALDKAEHIIQESPENEPLPGTDDEDCCKSLRVALEKIAAILEKDAAGKQEKSSKRPRS